ncbi:MAG: putative NRPS-like protein biosynthetic cluster [Bathelium mastoideum]|nr:MAG: putative NRPS-like protein biosynthetic cluster [Bathelium mastoideum]
MLTSGTTGLPKAAAISHYAQLAQAVMLYDSKDKCYEVKRLLSLPQFHSFTATLAHIAPLREGHTTYIMKRHHADQYLEYIKLYQITETAMVPPIVLNYLARPPPDQKLLSSLRYIWCAGAPLSASTHERILHVLDPAAIFSQVWGMSETGRLLPNMEAKIMGKNNEEILEDMQPGEILVRGPSLMSGYLGNAQATRSCFVNGWLKTGDIGYRRNGKWYITDRAKELIKVRAWQVSPTELETCLLAHSSIIDAAVVGVQISEVAGELPRGYVVLNPKSNGQVTEMEIQQHIQKRLAKYKALDAGVKFVDSIPRGASGKILREKLKKRALEEIKKENDVNGLRNGGINGVRAQGEQKEHT